MKKLVHELMVDNARREAASGGIEVPDRVGDIAAFLRNSLVMQVNAITRRDVAIESIVASSGDDEQELDLIPTLFFGNHDIGYMFLLYHVYKNGNNSFVVNKALALDLWQSDVTVDVEDLKPPFRAFVIYLDDSAIKGYTVVHHGNASELVEYDVEVVYVRFRTVTDDRIEVEFIAGYRDEHTGIGLRDWSNTNIIRLTIDKQQTIRPLKDSLLNVVRQRDTVTPEMEERIAQTGAEILNLIFGFILYLNHKPEDIELHKPHPGFSRLDAISNPKKRKRLQNELADESPYVVRYVGRRYGERVGTAHPTTSGREWALEHLSLTRGHWRYQWYGRKTSDKGEPILGEYRKIIWIEPFYRGYGEEKAGAQYRVEGRAASEEG